MRWSEWSRRGTTPRTGGAATRCGWPRSRRARLRLGLRVDSDLARLPWETLWLADSGRPVVLDALVRMYRRVQAPPVVATAGPLRILVAVSAPLTGGGVLDYERELRS